MGSVMSADNDRSDSPDVLVIKLSEYHSLDLVRIPSKRKYKLIISERFGVKRRTEIEVSFEDGIRAARFLVSVDDSILIHDKVDRDEPTVPGIPRTLTPPEILESMGHTMEKYPVKLEEVKTGFDKDEITNVDYPPAPPPPAFLSTKTKIYG